MAEIDPVSAEIHRKAIENLTNEAALTLIQTSGSPSVVDAKDFSTCLLDESGDQLGLSAYILFHSASSLIGVRAVMEQLATDGTEPQPGDGWLLNDPYHGGGTHQADLGVVTPMFYQDQLIGWAFSNCHVMDVGGSGVGGIAPGATSVYEEGLRFPATLAIRGGKLEKSWERYIAAAVRAPDSVLNDIRSMIASNTTQQRKLTEIIDRFGLDAHRAYNAHNKDLSEALLRSRIEKLPDGTYESSALIEYDGHGVEHLYEVRCRLEIVGSEMRFGLSGSPQADAFVNGTEGPAYGNIMAVLLTTLSYGDLPFNAGMWRPLTIDLGPVGTVVNAQEPAPVSLGHGEAGTCVVKAVRSALNEALLRSDNPVLRGRVAGMAGDSGVAAGLFGLTDAGDLTVLAYMDTISGSGGGAQTVADGLDIYGSTVQAGCGISEIESYEATDPVVFLWRKVAVNSSGPGQARGGNGMDRAYLLRGAPAVAGSKASFCELVPVSGFGGGSYPVAAGHEVIRGTTGVQAFSGSGSLEQAMGGIAEQTDIKMGRMVVERGDVVHAMAGGGGGLGDPLWRNAVLVERDVRDQYITATHAKAAYGVVVTDNGVLDEAATAAGRLAIRRQRIGREPVRAGVAPAIPGLAVKRVGEDSKRYWACASCETELCDGDQDFRLVGTTVHKETLEVRSKRLEMRFRPRLRGRPVEVTDHYCPNCASCVATDITATPDEGETAAA